MALIVHGLEVDYYSKINFAYLDVDNPGNDDFKRELGYRVQPHFFLIDGEGNILQQWVGTITEDVLIAAFDKALME